MQTIYLVIRYERYEGAQDYKAYSKRADAESEVHRFNREQETDALQKSEERGIEYDDMIDHIRYEEWCGIEEIECL